MLKDVGNRVQQLRQEFDNTFAEPAQLRREVNEDLVRIVVAGDSYALRVSEFIGLQTNLRIVGLPKRASEFLGLSSFRNEIVPVYTLRQLLGYGPGEQGRWMVIAQVGNVFGLEFQRFEGHVRASQSAVVASEQANVSRRYVRDVVQVGGEVLPIVSIAAISETIKQLSGANT